jgi:hypothetical protein
MAQEGLQIEIQANVQQAVQALKALEKNVQGTSGSLRDLAEKGLQSVNDKLARLQRLAASPNLPASQFEKLNKLIQSTSQSAVRLNNNLKFLGGQPLQNLTQGTNQANVALVNFGRVVQDAPFGLIGIANNIDPLISSFQQLKVQTGSSGAAFRALASSLAGPAGIAIAVSAVTSALIAFGPEIKNLIAGTKEVKASQDEAAQSIAKQYTQVLLLKTAYENAQGSVEDRKEALAQLSSISKEYFGQLNAEKTSIEQLKLAYDAYIDNLLRSFAVKQLEADLEPLIKKLAVAQSTIKRLGPDIRALGLEGIDLRNLSEAQRQAFASSGLTKYNAALNESRVLWEQINELINGASFLIENKQQKTITKTTAAIRSNVIEFQNFNAELIEADKNLDQIFRDFNLVGRGESLLGRGGGAQGLFDLQSDTSPLQQLDALAGEFEKVKGKASELQGVIDNGINAGIDQFFNALANNQDPFAALQQSVKRLVAELAAAVIKTLILKAIANSIAPGSGELVGQAANLGGRANRLIVNQLRVLG